MTTNNSDSTFVRRKFTITETLDNVLTELAAQNYQGNVSLCLRAAIEDHRATIEGTGTEQLAAQKLVRHLERVEEQQEEIKAEIKAMLDRLEDQNQAESRHHHVSCSGMTEDMHCIYDTLNSTDNELRIDDLAERLDLPASRLQPALGSLVDLGLVVNVGETTSRFQLAGYTACDFGSEQL